MTPEELIRKRLIPREIIPIVIPPKSVLNPSPFPVTVTTYKWGPKK